MYLVTWAGAGMISMMGALAYVELGTMIPLSGGEHTYLHKAFGPVVAFMFSWASVIVLKPASMSAICLACGNYITGAFFPNGICNVITLNQESTSKVIAAFALGECFYF